MKYCALSQASSFSFVLKTVSTNESPSPKLLALRLDQLRKQDLTCKYVRIGGRHIVEIVAMSIRATAFSAFRALVFLACAFAIQSAASEEIPTLTIPATSGFASFNSFTSDCPFSACGSLSGGNSNMSFSASFGDGGYLFSDFVVFAGDPISAIPLTMLTSGGNGPCGPCHPNGTGSVMVGATAYEIAAMFVIDFSSGSAIVPSGPATMTFPASMGVGGLVCTSIGPETSPCVPGVPDTVIIPYADADFGDISGLVTFTFTPFTFMYAPNAEMFSAVFTPGAPTPLTPEPSSSVLLIIGLAGVAVYRLRKREGAIFGGRS